MTYVVPLSTVYLVGIIVMPSKGCLTSMSHSNKGNHLRVNWIVYRDFSARGAYHLTEKSGWGVESIMVSDLPVYRRNATSVRVWIQNKGKFCVAWVWNREGTEKLINGKQHSVWFVPTGMKGLPQNVLLNFRLEFPKSDLTIYLPSGISDIFCQMVSTPGE